MLTPAGGRVIKGIGDAVLVVFPVERAADAVSATRALVADPLPATSGFGKGFGDDHRLHAKVHVGDVACGDLGPPGQRRFDIVGAAVNELFLLPAGECVLSDDLRQLLA